MNQNLKTTPKINVLYVSPFSNLEGGAQLSFIRLIENIDQNKFSIVVLVPRKGSLYDRLCDRGIKTYVADVDHWWHPTKRYYSHIFLSGLHNRIAQLLGIMKKEDIDIVHTTHVWAMDGAIAANIVQIPHVWHVRCVLRNHPLFEQDFRLQTPAFATLIGELSDRVLAISNAVKQSLIPYISPEKIDVLYNGILRNEFETDKNSSKDSIREELKLPNDTLIVSAIGRIDEIKGFDDFISASARIYQEKQDARFLLVGPEEDPSLSLSLRKQVIDMGLEGIFFFLGFRNDLPRILMESDVCVSSSISEGLSNVVLEAMAAGKPVVATRSGGPEEVIIDGETGFIVSVRKPHEIAEAVLKLLKNKGLREKMGGRGELLVKEQFTNERYVHGCESVYAELYEEKLRQSEGKNVARSIWLEMLVNLLSEIGDLRLKSLQFEERVKRLENFETQFKNNFVYQGARKTYHLFNALLRKNTR